MDLRIVPSQHIGTLGYLFNHSCGVLLLPSIKQQRYLFLDRMTQKVVLITGCSSGIGLSLAARIAKDEKKRFMGKSTVCL